MLPAIKLTKTSPNFYNRYIQNNVSTHSIFVLGINQTILIDACTKNIAKKIYDY